MNNMRALLDTLVSLTSLLSNSHVAMVKSPALPKLSSLTVTCVDIFSSTASFETAFGCFSVPSVSMNRTLKFPNT